MSPAGLIRRSSARHREAMIATTFCRFDSYLSKILSSLNDRIGIRSDRWRDSLDGRNLLDELAPFFHRSDVKLRRRCINARSRAHRVIRFTFLRRSTTGKSRILRILPVSHRWHDAHGATIARAWGLFVD